MGERTPARCRPLASSSSARDLTPFRVTGRVQQSVWKSLGDYDLATPGQLDAIKPRPRVLVVHGREDPIPLSSSELYADRLNAELVVIPDCGHVPYVEQPERLTRAVEEFITTR